MQLDYFSELYALVSRINKSFNNSVMPKVEMKKVQKEIVLDESAFSIIGQAFDDFKKGINARIDEDVIKRIAQKITEKTFKRNRSLWKSKLNDFGIDIGRKMSFEGEQDYIKSRIKTNIKLITKLKDEYLSQLELELSDSYEKGIPAPQLAKNIQQRFKISAKKAKLIARNETKNTNSQLNKKQAAELGFDKAVWLTSIDGRERPEHREHNKKTYTIGVGLPDGQGGKEEPGYAINCRCTFYIEVE